MPGLLGPAFRERLSAAMRIPVAEALSPEPWTAAARRVLPSPSPQMTATAMWAPIIAWSALETLAESIAADNSEKIALDVFDKLRLRKALAEAFNSLGFEGESGWRAAARIKVLLLAESESPASTFAEKTAPTRETTPPDPALRGRESQPSATIQSASDRHPTSCGLPPSLWSDPDVRWLTGAHEAGDYTYLVLEPYEELLWWLQLPSLLQIAGSASPSKKNIQAIHANLRSALAEAERAGYRVQTMLAPETKGKENVPISPEGAVTPAGSSPPKAPEKEKQTI